MPPFTILLAFSGLTRSLVTTDYNRRVDECTAAARTLLDAAGRKDSQPLLGNVSLAEYLAEKHHLNGAASQRAEHYFSEVARVEQGVQAWCRGDLVEFGRLMTESCSSSIHNYECGATPLVVLYELLISLPGVFGTGSAGRVSVAAASHWSRAVLLTMSRDTSIRPTKNEFPSWPPAGVLLCHSDDGARIV